MEQLLRDMNENSRQLAQTVGMVNDNVRTLTWLLMLAFVMILTLVAKTMLLRRRLDKQAVMLLRLQRPDADATEFQNPQKWSDQL